MKESFTIVEQDLHSFAEKIVTSLSSSYGDKAKVVFLEGDLGAGKTTFTKHVAEVLGIHQDDVSSPTFILKRSYKTDHPTFRTLVHIDAYRFSDPEEAKSIDLDRDIENKEALIMIEWPSKLGGKVAEDMHISLDVVDESTRTATVSYTNNPFRL